MRSRCNQLFSKFAVIVQFLRAWSEDTVISNRSITDTVGQKYRSVARVGWGKVCQTIISFINDNWQMSEMNQVLLLCLKIAAIVASGIYLLS